MRTVTLSLLGSLLFLATSCSKEEQSKPLGGGWLSKEEMAQAQDEDNP